MPLHPFLVHFPLALVVTGWLFFTLGFFSRQEKWAAMLKQAGRCCLLVAALTALPALVSGHWLEQDVALENPALVPQIQAHEHAATFAAWMLVGLAASVGLFHWLQVKNRGADFCLWVLWALALGLMMRVGYLGALLVHGP